MKKSARALLRHLHALKITVIFIIRSLSAWGAKKWFRFWFTGSQEFPHREITFKLRGNKFRDKVVDGYMAFSCITEKQYHPIGFELHPGDTVLDIGGHIGSFTVQAAKAASKVFVFEPTRESFNILNENILANNLSNVSAERVCIAGENGTRLLYRDIMNNAMNGLYKKTRYSEPVLALSLSSLFSQRSIDRCDFLKIDCEGAEYEILFSTPKEVLDRVSRIVLEYHRPPYYGLTGEKNLPEKLVQYLREMGFEAKIVPESIMHGLIFARQTHAWPQTLARQAQV